MRRPKRRRVPTQRDSEQIVVRAADVDVFVDFILVVVIIVILVVCFGLFFFLFFFSSRARVLQIDAHIDQRRLEQLEQLVPGAASTGDEWRGHHLPLSSWRWDQPDGPVLLVGDAAGLVNPLTGEGIYYAVATGIAAGRTAARAVALGRPEAAGARHRHVVRTLLGAPRGEVQHEQAGHGQEAVARHPSPQDTDIELW